jgi:hypothetical protein
MHKQLEISDSVMLNDVYIYIYIYEVTYVRDFPLKTIGGATAAKIQNPR